jgi:hypothetical protein
MQEATAPPTRSPPAACGHAAREPSSGPLPSGASATRITARASTFDMRSWLERRKFESRRSPALAADFPLVVRLSHALSAWAKTGCNGRCLVGKEHAVSLIGLPSPDRT